MQAAAAGDRRAAAGDVAQALAHYRTAALQQPAVAPIMQRVCHTLALLERPAEASHCCSAAIASVAAAEAYPFHMLLGEIRMSEQRASRAAKSLSHSAGRLQCELDRATALLEQV